MGYPIDKSVSLALRLVTDTHLYVHFFNLQSMLTVNILPAKTIIIQIVTTLTTYFRALVAQLVEHRAAMWEVVSSTPAGPTLRVLK